MAELNRKNNQNIGDGRVRDEPCRPTEVDSGYEGLIEMRINVQINLGLFVRIMIILAASAAICACGYLLKSDRLFEFLYGHIITLLLTLLAIHTTTICIIMAKLKELVLKYGGSVKATIKELKFVVWVQIVLIPFSALIVMLKGSELMKVHSAWIDFSLDTLLLSCLVTAFWNMKEVALAVFYLLEFEDDLNKEEKPPEGGS